VRHGKPLYDFARPSQLEPLLVIADVARLLSVTTRTVYRLRAKGDLHAIRVGCRLRFEPDEIRSYIIRQRRRPTRGLSAVSK
jgi:excisionase family DNA binding protein